MRVLAVFTIAAGLVACTTAGTTGAATDEGTVTDVVDGDTIDVTIGGRQERVRLLGIDTPEVYADEGPECFGAEASAFTAELLPAGTSVRLRRDVVGRDDYGRLLAYVYRTDDATMVNEALVREGYARPLHIAPNGTFARRFVAAAVAAEAAGLGLWSACGG